MLGYNIAEERAVSSSFFFVAPALDRISWSVHSHRGAAPRRLAWNSATEPLSLPTVVMFWTGHVVWFCLFFIIIANVKGNDDDVSDRSC